jgi:hypothetical protein
MPRKASRTNESNTIPPHRAGFIVARALALLVLVERHRVRPAFSDRQDAEKLLLGAGGPQALAIRLRYEESTLRDLHEAGEPPPRTVIPPHVT